MGTHHYPRTGISFALLGPLCLQPALFLTHASRDPCIIHTTEALSHSSPDPSQSPNPPPPPSTPTSYRSPEPLTNTPKPAGSAPRVLFPGPHCPPSPSSPSPIIGCICGKPGLSVLRGSQFILEKTSLFCK